MLIKDYQITDYTMEQFKELRAIAEGQGLFIHPYDKRGLQISSEKGGNLRCSGGSWGSFRGIARKRMSITATRFLRLYHEGSRESESGVLTVNEGDPTSSVTVDLAPGVTDAQTLVYNCGGPHVLIEGPGYIGGPSDMIYMKGGGTLLDTDKGVPIRHKDGILPVSIEPVCTLRTLKLALIDHLRDMTLSELEPTQNLLVETLSIFTTKNLSLTELNKKIEKFIKDLSTEEEC